MPVDLLGAAEIRRLAQEIGLSPRKALGQNFVIDANTIRRIVRTARVTAGEHVLEVGPGLGSLTLGLLAAGAEVIAVEADPRMAELLSTTVAAHTTGRVTNVDVVTADVLRLDRIPGGRAGSAGPPTKLVANLPYNVAVPILLHLLQIAPSVVDGLVMVQSEVAARLTAPPGSRTYGSPSAKLAYFATARRAGAVSRAVFWPAPRVDSELVAFTRHDPPAGPPKGPVFAVIDTAFGQRRKTLRSALAGWAGSAEAAERLIGAAGLDPRARGEQLTVTEFARLAAVKAAAGP